MCDNLKSNCYYEQPNNNNNNQQGMCGTFTQIFGMGAVLMLEDQLIRPTTAGSEFGGIIDVLFKGIVTFYVYKWFQCKADNTYSKNPLQGMSFMSILVGGVIGSVILLFAGNLVNENALFQTGIQSFFKYMIEAVILQVGYNISANIVSDFS